MKKMFAFLAAVGFLGTGTLSVTACGVSQGQKIPTNVNAPEKANQGQDPTNEYVYNDKYVYSQTNINLAIGVASQLAVQRIRDTSEGRTTDIWKEFYNSDEWKTGFFTSFNHDQHFSFKAKGGKNLIYYIKNNDFTDDNNKLRSYWFVTSSSAGETPLEDNIDIPATSEFDEKDNITRNGWIHIYLKIGKFRIDFDAQIKFVFSRVYDSKKERAEVILNNETFTKPFGTIDFNHPENVYKERIDKINITKENS